MGRRIKEEKNTKKHKGANIPKATGFFTKHHRLVGYVHYSTMFLVAMVIFLCAPGLKKYSKDADGTNLVSVYMNGTLVGTVEDTSRIDSIVTNARKRVARENTGLVLIKADIVLRGSTEIFGTINTDEEIEENVYRLMLENSVETKESAYEVKINRFTVKLKTADEVIALLEAAKNVYDTEDTYSVNLVLDPTRELDVLTTEMVRNDEKSDDNEEEEVDVLPKAGISQKFEQFYNEANEYEEIGFTLGIKSIDFNENVEVVKTYVDKDEISTLDAAIAEVTKEKETSKIYVVESGDTIGLVAQKNGLSVDELLEMNSSTLENENSMLHVGDELKVTSPEPELSILKTEEKYFADYYDAEVQYIDNDDWYTTEQKVLQEPEKGYRKMIADITYKNDEQVRVDIVYENIVKEAIPKIVERGTKTPPTYIYPVSGRVSSSFGRRKAPKKGASTYHKGMDFAVPTGTAIRATSGGVVTKAGWGSGYGYVVYIRHPDGKESRYGHCSKVLVKAGQSVKQGEKIALSGNTGISTGPHLHFEILVGGSQVNPLKYLN
ncbi:MAG: M23 family metallopeptidase [Lachnospiraceae bacterium]|jgi:murein DD-endopeptidase MepM/ murein hydrolase activator NlpD|nr:M23 family metallopeptidase [Lachnospiraceae bacterium]MCI6665450.1 M23 family metallopeptidase [Lachnospiraceae bacterium]MCI6978649.1 M23 family metallopeptidase [Lachnospiraceae bacterium]MDD6580824.1 M23 family metallopeptidase [Lachnospiraceae bacterium]MDY3254419.1 M23 family metallopeptidase [Lachnospiraceae bacterium]